MKPEQWLRTREGLRAAPRVLGPIENDINAKHCSLPRISAPESKDTQPFHSKPAAESLECDGAFRTHDHLVLLKSRQRTNQQSLCQVARTLPYFGSTAIAFALIAYGDPEACL